MRLLRTRCVKQSAGAVNSAARLRRLAAHVFDMYILHWWMLCADMLDVTQVSIIADPQ